MTIMKNLQLWSLLSLVLLSPTKAKDNVVWWKEPLGTLLDMSCLTFIVFPLQNYDKVHLVLW